MKDTFDDIPIESELAITSEQSKSSIIDGAVNWLIMQAGGSTHTDDWVKANYERLLALVNDPSNKYIERLADQNTRETTLNEIREKLYH